MISRRSFLSITAGGAAVAFVTRDLHAVSDMPVRGAKAVVYLSPTCGCCADWVKHLKKSGFAVDVKTLDDVDPIKREHKVPEKLWSCHTALVGGYVIEGHVPADLIARLLRERPSVAGLAVPGMPMGAPGMEQDGRKEPYDVFSFTCCGDPKVYAKR